MTDLLFIAGAPGVGKSSLAKLLHDDKKGPLFEFGWIPEFRTKGEAEISYEEEEQMSFENLILVVKNYLRHGFKNLLVTDLEDKRIAELGSLFSGENYKIITLTINDDEELKARVLSQTRQNDYRDFEQACAINRTILSRPAFPNEVRIDTTGKSLEKVFEEVKVSI